MKLKGRLTISRYSSNQPLPRPVHIELKDALSGCTFAEVEVSLEDFANAVLGLGQVPCELEVCLKAPLGKVVEVKTVILSAPYDVEKGKQEEYAAALLAPHEVDGWEGRVSDVFNHHNRLAVDKVSVSFRRYVDPTPERLAELEEQER